MKLIILSILMLSTLLSNGQKFYVLDEGNGIGTPIKEALLKSSQNVTELQSKADYILKTELTRSSTLYTRPKIKIMLIDATGGDIIFETPESKFSYSMYTGVGAGAEKEARKLMEKYGHEIILAAQKSSLEIQLKKDSLKKG